MCTDKTVESAEKSADADCPSETVVMVFDTCEEFHWPELTVGVWFTAVAVCDEVPLPHHEENSCVSEDSGRESVPPSFPRDSEPFWGISVSHSGGGHLESYAW